MFVVITIFVGSYPGRAITPVLVGISAGASLLGGVFFGLGMWLMLEWRYQRFLERQARDRRI